MAKNKRQPRPERDYEVGYGKPPKATQFQKGQSGNSKGRPKGAKNTATLLNEILEEKVSVRVGDRVQKMSKREVIYRAMVTEAMGAQPRAFDRITRLEQEQEKRNPAPLNGGHPVLLVPAPIDPDEWEKAVAAQQAKWAGNTGEEDED